mmetsp:Transcript_9369/g.16300  ORF Transcript_9369/g.16300 Transcript_9369/m.16300 type:complete len:295 (-) Transcript_9369:98-982(-)|eukprot:CAMPEP_0183710762 /NCGR_PEP_ID=MMETSP0737-20130205/6409_1 /TAXON_ID=385413 /ORGANISM="Thalassiosira miniscula, Strain CCMP1093" /LENGTH=294 /DNA_ID=CAMNT_0025939097 /DNA_START=112 /DNA_END=996 /DNA_ORIENTATION=-
MVELLEPGTEAETCLMAGRGMNGLRGIIVCYNPHNQRYTLELEKGDMMNLRSRNVRRLKVKSEEANAEDDKDDTPEITADDGKSKIESSLPNTFQPSEDHPMRNNQEQPRVQDTAGASLLEMISPTNALLVALVAYFYLQSRASNGGQRTKHAPANLYDYGDDGGITWPTMITCVVYAYVAWEWGTKPRQCDDRTEFRWSNLCLRLSFADVWEMMGLAGLLLWCLDVQIHHFISIGVLIFFGWKFGTRDGNRSFSWGNVKASLSNLSIWEVWLLAGVLEGGLLSMNAMARPRRR